MRSSLGVGFALTAGVLACALAGGQADFVPSPRQDPDLRSTSGVLPPALPSQAQPPAQVSRVRAVHRSGQTLVTWQESMPLVTSTAPSFVEVTKLKADAEKRRIRYRVYRSASPITSVQGMRPVGEVGPMTGWNTEFHGLDPASADPRGEWPAIRYVIEDGAEPPPPNSGVFAFNPAEAGSAYYAVTAVLGGVENRTVTGANVAESPVAEVVGPGEPVLQRVAKPAMFGYVENPTLEYYTRWEMPPNASIPGKPLDYLVGLPPNRKKPSPAGIHMHCYGATLESCFGWWFNGDRGAVYIASNQFPYDWWTGYHERIYTETPPTTREEWTKGVVRPFTQRRMLSFLEWAAKKYDLDLNRTFVAGVSMGGSGSLMLAIRFPQRIAWAASWVGVHTPMKTPTFKGSYQYVYGDPEWGVRFEDGTPVWDYFDDVKYLRAHVDQSVPLLIFANGKNDHDIGWPQAVEFFRALQETRQPHVFVWGQNGHGERARMPPSADEQKLAIDVTINGTLPAFTRCSLDDDPGNGLETDGAPGGQANLYLGWDPASARDEADTWQMTIRLGAEAPRDRGTVDVTPRKVQHFKTTSGETIRWTATSAGRDGQKQSGEVAADQYGLVTVPQITVTKAGTRVTLLRGGSRPPGDASGQH